MKKFLTCTLALALCLAVVPAVSAASDDNLTVGDLAPTGLSLAIAGQQVNLGETKDVQVTFKPAVGVTMREVVWTVENPAIAEVTESPTTDSTDVYLVRGLKRGSTTITAVSTANPDAKDSLEITVIGGENPELPDEKSDGSGCSAGLSAGALLLVAVLTAARRRG
ncbi:MAG: Ig-like domain-containing protein [Synergistaceae bacterium]|jgi:hypothetical protein|nr:Ig-like domain-containing protein [Synergistaceae bacterium]